MNETLFHSWRTDPEGYRKYKLPLGQAFCVEFLAPDSDPELWNCEDTDRAIEIIAQRYLDTFGYETIQFGHLPYSVHIVPVRPIE